VGAEDCVASKFTVCPTVGDAGEKAKTAVGDCAAVVLTVTDVEEVPVFPRSSVTVSVTVNDPTRPYRVDVVTPDPVFPSPNVQSYPTMLRPAAAFDPDALKKTVWFTVAAEGDVVKAALGSADTPTVTNFDVAFCRLRWFVTVNVTV
jgi:hypothetical protein